MIEFAKDSIAINLEGELIIVNYDKLLHDEINEQWEKSGKCANDAGGTVTKTKDLIKKVSFELKFKLIAKCKNREHEFNSDPIQHSIKECDNEARKVIDTFKSKTEEGNMDEFGKRCISTNDGTIDRPMREVV